MTSTRTRRVLSLIVAAAVSTTAVANDGITNVKGSARVEAYRAEDGSSYFALMLKAKGKVGATTRKHIVLFDTSASQAGEHRDHGLAVLENLMKRFEVSDKVALMAVDVQAKALTNGFVPANSAEAANGLLQLESRIPLGATDMEAALNEVLQQSDGTPTSVLYIGDGLSTANLMMGEQLRHVVHQLRDKRVVFNSYAVGPNRDLELLGILAVQTGGVVLRDTGRGRVDDSAIVAGYQLANAVHHAVTYMSEMPAGLNGVYPSNPVPLRSDRETVFIGKGDFVAPSLSTNVATATGDQARISWNVGSSEYSKRNGVLPGLYERGAELNGLGVGVAGETMLQIARTKFNLKNSVQLAMAQDDGFGQEQPAESAPAPAENIPAPAEGAPAAAMPLPAPQDSLVLPADPVQGGSANDSLGAPKPGDDDPISAVEERVRVRTEYLARQVQVTLRQVERIQRDEPVAAQSLLKDVLETVKASTDIDPDARQDMLRRLQSSLNGVAVAQQLYEQQAALVAQKLSAYESRRSMITTLQLEEERLQTLIETVRQHIEEARKGDDAAYEEAKIAAKIAIDVRPGNGPSTQAFFDAEAASQLNRAYRLRALRSDRFLETLYQVERSHVPFPDEPPVIYPAAEVWNALSLRRIERWSSVDLAKESEAARRIRRALDSPTDPISGGDSLKTVLDFISEVHGFTIIPDKNALSDVQIDSLEDITVAEDLQLDGISLKSAMKILFEQLEGVDEPLTYLIKNEVMYITTQAEADSEENYQTRVYPVADLVIPIQAGGQQGGGLGGGQGGGGLGGGGLGGGLGGGGAGLGGGGGAFNVPPTAFQKKTAPKK